MECFIHIQAKTNANLSQSIRLIKSKELIKSTVDYLHHVKMLVDSIVVIQSSVSDRELIWFTTSRLPPDYHSFVTIYCMLLGGHTFDDLRAKLTFYE